MHRRHLLFSLPLSLCLLSATARAAGPLMVNGAGQPLIWATRPIPYNPDQGELGLLSNPAALSFVTARFATWGAVSTASINFTNAGALPVDVTVANATQYFGVCGDHLNPIIFDTDGSIIRSLFGVGQENIILGATGADCVTYVPPVISEASSILNGRFIDGISTQLNPELPLSDFAGVFTHEFGHYIGIGHSQINLIEAFDGNAANDNTIATMFPILVNGTEQSSLNLDDQVAVSMLYPSSTFFATSGSIRGSILRPTSSAPFQGAYVIARDVSNPRLNAVGIASGFLFAPINPGGPPPPNLKGYYELDGLTPGSSYTIEVESIDQRFTGGSSIGPLDPPAVVPVPEFWNGANEAATNPPDNPSAATPVQARAGNPVTGINIILNTASGALPTNDLCTQATLATSFPFAMSADTTGAGESPSDPPQGCTNGNQNSNTVWYAMVPPEDGILTIDTCGSNYDTVVSVSTGSCSSLTPIACNDDVGISDPTCGATQSRVSFEALAGQVYLIDVSQFGTPGGGNLVLHAALRPRNCTSGDCLAGRGNRSTDCVAEWLVEPSLGVGRRAGAITCHDGDVCDADNDPTNHSCRFHVAVCLNNHDPNVQACTPSDTALVEVVKPDPNALRSSPEDLANGSALLTSLMGFSNNANLFGICRNRVIGPNCRSNADCNSPGMNDGRCYEFVRFLPALNADDRCSPSADVVVPLRVGITGNLAYGTKHLRLKSTTAEGVVDRDVLTLRCLPPS